MLGKNLLFFFLAFSRHSVCTCWSQIPVDPHTGLSLGVGMGHAGSKAEDGLEETEMLTPGKRSLVEAENEEMGVGK